MKILCPNYFDTIYGGVSQCSRRLKAHITQLVNPTMVCSPFIFVSLKYNFDLWSYPKKEHVYVWVNFAEHRRAWKTAFATEDTLGIPQADASGVRPPPN